MFRLADVRRKLYFLNTQGHTDWLNQQNAILEQDSITHNDRKDLLVFVCLVNIIIIDADFETV